MHKPSGADLLADGWLPPGAAARELGITRQQLDARVDGGTIRRKRRAPGVWLYEVRA